MKRFIFFCGLITASNPVEAQISVFNCTTYPTHLSQAELDAAQQFNSSTCYILGENSSVHLKANDNKEITATHEIILKDNVHLGVFNANGGTHLEIKAKSGLDLTFYVTKN